MTPRGLRRRWYAVICFTLPAFLRTSGPVPGWLARAALLPALLLTALVCADRHEDCGCYRHQEAANDHNIVQVVGDYEFHVKYAITCNDQ